MTAPTAVANSPSTRLNRAANAHPDAADRSALSTVYSQDRTTNRRVFVEAWRKARAGAALDALEQRIVDLIERHPEYRAAFRDEDDALTRDWLPALGEVNPFLHLSLHLAVIEQITTDQPVGIRKLFARLVAQQFGDTHGAEHQVMECLAEALWQSQRDGQTFRPKAYLKCIRRRSPAGV